MPQKRLASLVADHRVALKSSDEPGHLWTSAVCSCTWQGSLRVARGQAAIDAAWHLADPIRVDFGPDWHDVVGDERAQIYRRYELSYDMR